MIMGEKKTVGRHSEDPVGPLHLPENSRATSLNRFKTSTFLNINKEQPDASGNTFDLQI